MKGVEGNKEGTFISLGTNKGLWQKMIRLQQAFLLVCAACVLVVAATGRPWSRRIIRPA